MRVESFSVRTCQMAPDCQVNWENVALLNQFVVYAVASVAGAMMSRVYVVLAVRKVVAKGRRLLGLT